MTDPQVAATNGSRSLEGVGVVVVSAHPASELAVASLLNENCDVRIVRTAEEALALIRCFAARVVVTDLVLPRMSGLVLARRLKSDPTTRDIVVVAIGPFDAADAETMAKEAGCAAYIRTPFDEQRYVSTVATALAAESSRADQ